MLEATRSRMLKMTLGVGLSLASAWFGAAPPGSAQETSSQEASPQASAQAEERSATPQVPPRRRARARSRESASLDLDGAKVEVAWGLATAKDLAAVDELEAGEVIQFPGAAALKLMTAADLLFGDLRVVKGNAAEDYPGVYSLWIERTEGGWSLVFNDKADVWGTQHDPAADAGRVVLSHGESEGEAETFRVELLDEQTAGGLLVLTWGHHRWSAPFRLAARE